MGNDQGEPDPRDGSALCTSCGLCCNGVLYTHARAQPEEVERLGAAGMPTRLYGGKLGFALPCPKLEGTRCTIYEERFTICRTFRCELLRGYQEGRIPLPAALRSVAAAKDLVARTVADDPGAGTLERRHEIGREAADWAAIEDPAQKARAARLYLNARALELLLAAKFRKKRASSAAPAPGDEPAEEAGT